MISANTVMRHTEDAPVTQSPQVARADGEHKTGSAKAGGAVPWVDYDPIMRDQTREREARRHAGRNAPMWTGD